MKERAKRMLQLALVVALAALLSACGGGETPEPVPEPTPEQTRRTEQPTPEPTATPEPTPTPTPARTVKGYDFAEPAAFVLDIRDLRMKAPDGSYISMLLTKSDEDVTARAEDAYIQSLVESYSKEGEADIALEEYERMENDGTPAIHAVYTLKTADGASRRVLERILQSGDTVYRVRFTDVTRDNRWMDTFRKSADTVNVMWEDEEDASALSKLVLYDDEGLAICMPKKMRASALEERTVFYYGDEYMMTALREGFIDYAEIGMDVDAFTLEEYAALLEEANGMATPFAPDRFGNLAATYTNTVDSGVFFYYATVRKGSDAFWLVNLACKESQQDEYRPQFELWANSIQVE